MISLLKFDQKGEISSGIDNSRLRKSRSRLIAVGLMVLLAFGIIITRLINLTILSVHAEKVETRNYDRKQNLVSRPDILDRNGVVLATSLPTMSLYADPLKIINGIRVSAICVYHATVHGICCIFHVTTYKSSKGGSYSMMPDFHAA